MAQVAPPGHMPPPAPSDVYAADPGVLGAGRKAVEEPGQYQLALRQAINDPNYAPSTGRKIAAGLLGALGSRIGMNPIDTYRFITQGPARAHLEQINPELVAAHAAEPETLEAFKAVAPQVTSRFGTAGQIYSAQQATAQQEADRAQREREQTITQGGVPGMPGVEQPLAVPRFSSQGIPSGPAASSVPGAPTPAPSVSAIPGATQIGAPKIPLIKGEAAHVKIKPEALKDYDPSARFSGIDATKRSDLQGNVHYYMPGANGREITNDVMPDTNLAPAPSVDPRTGIPEGVKKGDVMFAFDANGKLPDDAPKDVKDFGDRLWGTHKQRLQEEYGRQDEAQDRQQLDAIQSGRDKLAILNEQESATKRAVDVTNSALGTVNSLLKENPDITGPVMGRLERWSQGAGTSFGFQDPKKEAAAAELASNILALIGADFRAKFPGRPSTQMFNYYKSASPEIFQDKPMMGGFLKGIADDAKRNTAAVDSAVKSRLDQYNALTAPKEAEIEARRKARRAQATGGGTTQPTSTSTSGFSIIGRGQ